MMLTGFSPKAMSLLLGPPQPVLCCMYTVAVHTAFQCLEINASSPFAVQDGSVDTVASDHSPSTPDVKLFDTGDFLNSWGGFAGLSTESATRVSDDSCTYCSAPCAAAGN